MKDFKERLARIDTSLIRFESLQTLQVNLGNLCNMRCRHCHVDASPDGNRIMGKKVMETVIAVLSKRPGLALDMTGGCPEMHPGFREFVEKSAGICDRRIVRSNLTILSEPGYEWLAGFFREQGLVVTASLPCYLEENVDLQRGRGAHARSLEGLRRLNTLGYGEELELNLVYNPGGETLPGPQQALEAAYRRELAEKYGIRFSRLFAMANAPIGRFRRDLESRGRYERYLNLLATHFNSEAARHIMCRTLLSVDWQGVLYNCDFNQALGLPIKGDDGRILTLTDLEEATCNAKELLLAQHCYGCSAGEGSSCSGALVA